MEAANDPKTSLEAFGRDLGALMRRLELQCGRLPDTQRPVEIRHYIGSTFVPELEELIARHRPSEAIAEYARHVVREGFHVAFDQMDPTDEALRVRAALGVQAPGY